MKKHFFNVLVSGAFLLLTLCAAGCSDDDGYADVDGQNPTVSLSTEHIQSGAGRTFTIAGTATDKDGISSIKLECADLNLEKTIDLIEIYDNPQETYELSYKFSIPKNEIGDSFTIKVTVTDVGGRSVSQDLLVTMDGDFEKPVFTVSPSNNITVLIKTDTKFNLRFSLSDDRALDNVTVSIPGIDNFNPLTISANGQKTLDFSEKITLPNVPQQYTATITAKDMAGNSTVLTSVISVSAMPDFATMYLADVATAAELNSDVFGVPMLIKHTGEYQYKANYYCQKAGTEIYFLPQKTDFSPICFGIDPTDNSKLTDDPETAKPIVLNQANVYYEITFNVMTGAYALKTYSIADAIDPIPHKIGTTSMHQWFDANNNTDLTEFWIGYTTSGPSNVTRFVQDATNPHLFYLEDPLELEAGKNMNFIITSYHSDGWWNYCTWRVDNSAEPEIFDYYGQFVNPAWSGPTAKDNWAKPTVKVSGNYKFSFDAHLGRAKLVPVK